MAALLLTSAFTTTTAQTEPIRIDLGQKGAVVSQNLYGIFFEEISHAGDGGLYAELIQNRGFEEHVLPTGKVISLSGDAKDENSFEQPTKLSPRTTLFGKFGRQFYYEFSPMSFTIMRIKISK